MKEPKNPLLCDPETGICEIPANQTEVDSKNVQAPSTQKVKLIYYTDPICSSCWGIEPALRKLKLEYGGVIEVEYHMGGLLPDWSYNSGGISQPSHVAHHWDEVSVRYDMPIDGDVWLIDPLPSSYPPSIAFKAAQIQSEAKAILFLRTIREMVFLHKKNITRWEHLESAANHVGLNIASFTTDYQGKAIELFNADLELGKQLGVRGFPTIFFTNAEGRTEKVYGAQPYSVFQNTLLTIAPYANKNAYPKTWEFIFSKYPTCTLKEFIELLEASRADGEIMLDQLITAGTLEKFTTKNGSIWSLKGQP